MQELIDFISSCGFPIVMCLLMYKQLGESGKAHDQELKDMKEALENNNNLLSQLTEVIRGLRG